MTWAPLARTWARLLAFRLPSLPELSNDPLLNTMLSAGRRDAGDKGRRGTHLGHRHPFIVFVPFAPVPEHQTRQVAQREGPTGDNRHPKLHRRPQRRAAEERSEGISGLQQRWKGRAMGEGFMTVPKQNGAGFSMPEPAASRIQRRILGCRIAGGDAQPHLSRVFRKCPSPQPWMAFVCSVPRVDRRDVFRGCRIML